MPMISICITFRLNQPTKATPLPWKQVLSIGFTLLINHFSILVVFPLLPFMVSDFFPEVPKEQLGCVGERTTVKPSLQKRHSAVLKRSTLKRLPDHMTREHVDSTSSVRNCRVPRLEPKIKGNGGNGGKWRNPVSSVFPRLCGADFRWILWWKTGCKWGVNFLRFPPFWGPGFPEPAPICALLDAAINRAV